MISKWDTADDGRNPNQATHAASSKCMMVTDMLDDIHKHGRTRAHGKRVVVTIVVTDAVIFVCYMYYVAIYLAIRLSTS